MEQLLLKILKGSKNERTIKISFNQNDSSFPLILSIKKNGYEVISRSRMDIQTERLWLLGAKHLEEGRSGTMVFSSNEKRDTAYENFILAINEWAEKNNGYATLMD